jgi:cobalt-zinc-cadmium resistance protein CzcA
MLAGLIEFSLKNRFLILCLAGLVAFLGGWTALHLPIDAVPDMTNVQVTVVTEAGSLSPVEVERYITNPVEMALGGLPHLEELRSISRFGISVVTVVFKEGTDLYRARQLVNERLPQTTATIPAGYGQPQLGPLTTALGEILQFEVRSSNPEHNSMFLRSLLEWDIAPRLRGVSGVTEINSHGGYYKSYEVSPNPDKLQSLDISLAELFSVLEENNLTTGGGYVVHNNEQRFIRGQAMLRNIADIENVVIRKSENGSPILIRDVATVQYAPLTRQGSVTRDGRGEIVTGMVMMLIGENSRVVVGNAKERLAEIQKTLPPGVEIEIIYDRAELINRTLSTVVTNLVEGGTLVIIVLLVMLGSLRAGIITALAIPLAMLFATNLMFALGITASLMSLGAIDFGLIVDSSVIMVENCIHRLSHPPEGKSRFQIIFDACMEVRKPTMFGELIIAIVYVPILALQGTEGKLFRPMALTVLFALAGSLVLSMTLMPVLAYLGLPKRPSSEDVWFVRQVKRIYSPLVNWTISNPWPTVAIAVIVFLASLPIGARLGAEFMPRLDEGDLLIEVNRLPSAALEDALAMTTRIEKILLTFDEVRTVFCKTGRPEIANDVMGVQQTDVWVLLKPPAEWPAKKTREELIKEIDDQLREKVPGATFGFTQPIEMRVDELVAGVKADVAVLLYGDDLKVLQRNAKEIEDLLGSIPGAADVKADYQADLATLTIQPKPEALARYGIDAKQVMDVVTAIGGKPVGRIYEGRANYPIVVRIPEDWRLKIPLLEQLPVATNHNRLIPLSELASFEIGETPPSVEHESNRRRTFVSVNVRGRDVASFVKEAQRKVAADIQLPPGYEIRWGGDFENLQSASLRLMIITPVVLLLIFLLLLTSFGSASLASLISLAVPIAASGGVFTLALRGMPFSISAGVGFIALFGVAVLNGLVWVSAAENFRLSGMSLDRAARETAMVRLRPILMTALVASLGFIPMALSTSAGSEIQRPLASVVIGGLITSTLLTTLVVPAIYPWFAKKAGVLPEAQAGDLTG